MKTFSQVIETIEQELDQSEFIATGFSKLDAYLDGGFLKRELIVIGAPTGKGKSYVASHLFSQAGLQGCKAAYFSLEISNQMVVSRIIGSEAGIKPIRLTHGFLDPAEMVEKKRVLDLYLPYEKLLYFYDDLYTLEEIEAEIITHSYEYVIIDFVQNIVDRGLSEYERLTYISLSLQKLAKSAHCCIILLSQLSNQMSRDNALQIVEYRGSGGIGIACDLGFFIESAPTEFTDVSFSLKLRKNRRGLSGASFDFHFDQPGGKITQL